MKWFIRIPVVMLVIAALCGCQGKPPSGTIALVDVTQSIDRDGVSYEFTVIDGLVDRMQRGDSLTVIPITGNAMSEIPGHILHFIAPTEREAYDYDLRVFREQAHRSVRTMQAAALANPSGHTDLLGTLDVAKQELHSLQSGDTKSLIVMSDFLEDDGACRFTTDKTMADPAAAQSLAEDLKTEHDFMLYRVHVSLNALQSKDLRSIGPVRQRAVREFWKWYFGPATGVEIRTGGLSYQ